MRKLWIVLTVVFFVHVVALAQVDCPKLVQDTLKVVKNQCAQTARNQVCYGNADLSAVARNSVIDMKFANPGDLVNLVDIDQLTLSSKIDDAHWGIALMRLQANLPDSLPGQNLTFLLFGSVQVDNAVANIAVPLTTNARARLRVVPDASAPALSTIEKGQAVQANGQTKDGNWIRITAKDRPLWISAQVVQGDFSAAPVVDPTATPITHPMQAFYFTSGLGDRPCKEAPDSGVLVQTAKGTASAQFTVNGVDITLGSTVYLQANSGNMLISVVEGKAIITANNVTRFVPAGTFTQVPLDASGKTPSGEPTQPAPYDAVSLATLPVSTVMPRPVTVATPVPAEQVEQVTQETFAPNGLLDGYYTVGVTSFTQTKPDQYGEGYCYSKGTILRGLVVKNGHPEGFGNVHIISMTQFSFSTSYEDSKTGCKGTHMANWSAPNPPG